MNLDMFKKTAELMYSSAQEQPTSPFDGRPQFYMKKWFHDGTCGSPSCIAGWVCYTASEIKKKEFKFFGGSVDVSRFASKSLGIGISEATALFDESCMGWPSSFRKKYFKESRLKNPMGMAKVGYDLLMAIHDGKVVYDPLWFSWREV